MVATRPIQLQVARQAARSIRKPATAGHVIAGVLGIVALLGAAWRETFVEMWMHWFPAWNVGQLGLIERLTAGDSYYTHGPLVPLTSLAIAYLIYKRVGFAADRKRKATVLGYSILVVFLMIHLVGVYARTTFVSGFSLIAVLGGLILVCSGWRLASVYQDEPALPEYRGVYRNP